MSVAISVSEGQVVITLTLLKVVVVVVGVVVVGIVIVRVVVVGVVVVGVVVVGVIVVGVVIVRVSAVAAAVVVVSSSQESVQTKEPGPHIPLVRGLSLPPAAVAASAVASTKQGAQEPGVGLSIVRLSLASAAGVVVVVVAAVQSSAENSAAKETSAYSKEAAVNKAVTGAYDSLVSVRLCVSISV